MLGPFAPTEGLYIYLCLDVNSLHLNHLSLLTKNNMHRIENYSWRFIAVKHTIGLPSSPAGVENEDYCQRVFSAILHSKVKHGLDSDQSSGLLLPSEALKN